MKYQPYTALDFDNINRQAKKFADIIENNFQDLTDILLEYESYEVVEDETARTLDLLRNLKENKKYFCCRVSSVAVFLPRNQPLYAFACFVVIPSLMASEVHFRVPSSMRHFFLKMLAVLKTDKLFPNIIISKKQRTDFLADRSALRSNPKTGEAIPITDVVIFTGTSENADKLRRIFDKRTLFIANGAGHNPLVVSADADIDKAVDAVLTLELYNQGQDCAAPNAILVHRSIFANFRDTLISRLKTVTVGHYRDKQCRVGPISEPKDLARIENLLLENLKWINPATPGVIRARESIVEPTVICKPLATGGNFKEVFAPIIFLQKYNGDESLALYFEDQRYERHAMYVTLYGTSNYVSQIINRPINGKILHKESSVVRGTHLHAPGVERGTKPYGGHGYGASSLSRDGKIFVKPTLPQRDIYEWIVQPLLRKKALSKYRLYYKKFTKIEKTAQPQFAQENLDSQNQSSPFHENTYVDLHLAKKGQRYLHVPKTSIYSLLEHPNKEYALKLKTDEKQLIASLKKLLDDKTKISLEQFRTLLYAIPKKPDAKVSKNRMLQLAFFHNVYQLLFGEYHGPQLAPFLWEVDKEKVDRLLNI